MENLSKFLQNESILNGKSLKKAITLVRNVFNEDLDNSIQPLTKLLFNNDSKYYPPDFINQIVKLLDEKKLLNQFNLQADSLMNSSFWDSDEPNICSLINYSVISHSFFEGNEVFLFYFFIKFLFSFPLIIFDELQTLISHFLDHISAHHFVVPEELQQLCDDAFGKGLPQTILATHFIKMADQKVPVGQLSKSFSIALLCLQKAFSKDEIQQLRASSSNLFAASLKPECFLLLQSYFIIAIESVQLRLVFIEKVMQLLDRSTEQETFECIYTALLNVLQISELDQFIHFFVRDFDTSFDETRIVLMNCFDKLFQIDSSKLTTQLSPIVVKLPWFSRLKKFSYPYLIQNKNEDLYENLIYAAQDPQMKQFVCKCVTSLLQSSENNINQENAKAFQDIIEKFVTDTKLVLSKPLISFQNIFSVNQKFTELCVSKTKSFLIKFDAAIVNPKKFSSFITKDDLEKARKLFNWDLRIKCVAVFSAAGFPRSDEDGQLFIDSVPSLLMVDSQDNQTKLIRLFDDFMNSFSTKKTYSNVNRELFIQNLNQKLSPYLLPSCSSLIRQNALELLQTIWKRFPEISPFDRFNLTSILKDGTVSLKRLAYSASKYLKEPLISEKKVTINELPFNPTIKDIKINSDLLQRFTILLEQNEVILNLTETDIINLIQFSSTILDEKDREDDWEVISEIFHIICLLCLQLNASQETLEKATDHIFNSLIETRKSGLVMKCYPYLAQLIKKLKSSEKPKNYCQRLIQVLASFDMAQMRRSAGLPFISVALIKGNSDLFNDLTNALVNVCVKSENANEVANALNTLNLIVKENNSPESFFGVMFGTILKSCARFPSEWDVLSAVDLSYNSLLHKIWTFYVKETTFRALSRNAFLSKVENSRNVIIEALKSDCPHCIYLGLLIFTLFPRDAGDSRFVPFIIKHKSSKSSRIRRTAVRALLNVIPIGKEEEFVNQIKAEGMNETHFLAIFKHEVALIKNAENLYPYSNEVLKKIYPLLFEPDFENEKLVSKCLVLKNWNEKTAPETVQRKLVEDLIINNSEATNLTYLTEGLKFLIRTLPLNFIDNSQLHRICQLFLNTSELQIELKGLYLQLIRFVVNPSIDELTSEIVEIAANPFLIALHHAISSIADLVVSKSNVATLFLLLNDVPLIRQRVAASYSHLNNQCESFLNESEIIKKLIPSLNDNDKQLILKLFIKNIQSKLNSDEFGEPTYFLVDEFFILFECFNGMREKFYEKFNEPLSLNEMRKIIIDNASNLVYD